MQLYCPVYALSHTYIQILKIGYSDGHHRADDDDFTSGGQCEDGLKMIIAIGETESVTSGNRYGNSSQGSDPSPPTATQLAGEQVQLQDLICA